MSAMARDVGDGGDLSCLSDHPITAMPAISSAFPITRSPDHQITRS